MRYPEFLKDNGKIGFIAPSFGAVIEPYNSLFNAALSFFKAGGYETVVGPNCFKALGIGKSNTAEECGREINEFFLGDNCHVIISAGGGETMCEDLSFVDFEAIAGSKAKWFMGYSDNTNLTFTLPILCDTAAVYGPNASSFGRENMHNFVTDAFDLIKGRKMLFSNYEKWQKESADTENPLQAYNMTEDFEMKIYGRESNTKTVFGGRLLGGCLDCLGILCGTEFDRVAGFNSKYADDGVIWFLESCELSPMQVHRVLWQLDKAGWFKNVRGFLIGRPMLMDADGFGYDRFTAVTTILEKYNVPLVFDVDIGHLPPMMPMVYGAYADVEAAGNSLVLKYDFSR